MLKSLAMSLLIVTVAGPTLAADVSGSRVFADGVAISADPIVVPGCDDQRSLKGFRCLGNRLMVDHNDAPWIQDHLTVVLGPRVRPYQRLLPRAWGR
jgi:hypothetical protein